MKTVLRIVLALMTAASLAGAQVDHWMKIVNETRVDVQYYSPVRSAAFTRLKDNGTKEVEFGLTKDFSDSSLNVRLTFKNYGSHLELTGEASSVRKEDLCFTVKVIFPAAGSGIVTWSQDLDSTVSVGRDKELYGNYVDASSIVTPAGAFNADGDHNGGYGDKLGSGQMSFYPLAAVSLQGTGLGWGVSMGVPIVYRLGYEPRSGMVSEFDLATSRRTKEFSDRTFFKLLLFEYDADWHMRAAFSKILRDRARVFSPAGDARGNLASLFAAA